MTALHDREAPLRTLRDALANAHRGRGQLVLLAGEAGIGKSALASALAAEAQEHAVVTWGRAWEFAEAPPYWAISPCVRSLGVDSSLFDEGRAFELWEQVLAALARESTERTIVWLVEDLHAADLGTLDVLTFLVQPLRTMRVLVVATLRPLDARLDERKLQRLARMARDGMELRLEPLSEAAIATITEDAIGRALPAASLQRLVELTGGNPLFVIECARAVRAGGIERTLDRLPPSVRQIVIDRVALLPEATRGALEAGAILGRDCSAALIARMRDSEPSRVIDELLPALRAGVLRESKQGQFSFTHVIVRDAIEDAIGATARAALHGRAEAALGELGDTVEVLVERARHALAAAPVGDPMHAVAIAKRAADVLERDGAFDRAFALHQRIADGRASGFLPPATAGEKLHIARVARDAGRFDVMQTVCDEVLIATRAVNPELFAEAALLHATSVRPGVIDTRQVNLLEEARAMVSGPMHCRVLARLSTALQPTDDVHVPNELARTALREAHALADDPLILDVLELAVLGMYGSPREERIAWTEELRDRALAADDVPRALRAWTLLAIWWIEGGDHAELARAVTASLALSDRALHPRYRWEALLLASGYACMHGRYEESERYITEVAQIAALVDDPALALALVMHELMLAKSRRNRGGVVAALCRLSSIGAQIWRADLFLPILRAAAWARLGDVEATRAELASIGARARVFETDIDAISLLAEAYAAAGSDAERRWVRDVLGRTTTHELFTVGHVYDGSVERLLGLLDVTLGDREQGEARLRRVLENARAREHVPWIEQVERDLGRAVEPAPSPASATSGVLGMSRTGDVWTVEHDARVARVKDSRGVQLLARLVDRPGEEIHVLALASDEGTNAPESNAGEMLDERARKAYRKRVSDLEEALAAAEARGDASAASQLERERAALVKELARAAGIGGRTRHAVSATERARVNVQRRIKEAIARVADADQEIGQFLERAVRTGTFCCFRP